LSPAERLQEIEDLYVQATLGPQGKSEQIFLDEIRNQLPPQEYQRTKNEFVGFGPLQSLMDSEDVTEIIVNAWNAIAFERAGYLNLSHDHFVSARSYANFIDRLIVQTRTNPNAEKPFASGRLNDWRFHLALPPVVSGPTLTLRRHRSRGFTLQDLQQLDWAPNHAIDVLKVWIKEKRNLIVVGTTNSGKTSLVSALLDQVEDHERILILEDTDELKCPNLTSTKLLTRTSRTGTLPEINLGDLVFESLRMRPDRLVLGEMRGAEAKNYLLALSTGHAGSLATLHAGCPQQALLRLEFLVQMGAPEWNVMAIRKLIHSSLYGLVVVENLKGKRQLSGLYRISSLESSGFCIDTLYEGLGRNI